MKKNRLKTRLLCFLLVGLVSGVGSPVFAANYTQDDVYADSFGNLIIDSAAGYKRIIVGKGYQARKLERYMRGSNPSNSNGGYSDPSSYAGSDCYQPPVFVKGRSYMYGFDQGIIPLQGGPCR